MTTHQNKKTSNREDALERQNINDMNAANARKIDKDNAERKKKRPKNMSNNSA